MKRGKKNLIQNETSVSAKCDENFNKYKSEFMSVSSTSASCHTNNCSILGSASTWPYAKGFRAFMCSILTTSWWKNHAYHFTDEKTEVHRQEAICSWFQTYKITNGDSTQVCLIPRCLAATSQKSRARAEKRNQVWNSVTFRLAIKGLDSNHFLGLSPHSPLLYPYL